MTNLPKYIKDAVLNCETSLGDNPAFPPGITGGRFIDSLLTKRFDEVAKPFEGKSNEEIKKELSEALNKCKEIERTCKNALEKLCGDILNDLFKFPEDTVTIDLELSEREASQKMRMEPDRGENFTFDSVEDMGNLSYEIYKRRMTNALVEGASEFYAYNIGNYVSELFKIQPELPSLYSKIVEASQYLTLSEDDTQIDSTSNNGGYVVVKVGQIDEMPSVEARGSIFPILLQQAIRGILEISVLCGLPENKEKARYIMSKADFAMAEKWDSRLGYSLWQKIQNAVEKSGNNIEEVGYNFVLMELSEANTEIFNETLQEVFANTKKGVEIIGKMCNYITEQKKMDEFNDYIEQTNSRYPIEDGYFTAEELVRDLPVLEESVYINGVKGNKANLHYAKGSNYSLGNLRSDDMLKTDKMDSSSSDTYEVTLKGGLVSYNITSINGTEVMHYFKRYFDNQKTTIDIKTPEGQKQQYELQMQQNEFNDFMRTFEQKVGNVVRYAMQNMKTTDGKQSKFTGISIYPVKSSSNFNEKMAQELSKMTLSGFHVQTVDSEILSKDLKNLQRDEDFIEKNKDFFNSDISKSDGMTGTVSDVLNNNIEKYKGIERAEQNIEKMNEYEKKLESQIYNYHNRVKNGDNMQRMLMSMAANYMCYIDLARQCEKDAVYVDPSTGNEHKTQFSKIIQAIKYTKGPSVDTRTNELFKLMKPYMRGKKSPVDGKPYTDSTEIIPLCQWKKNGFQIKNLTNGERMGLKNIYRFSDNEQKVQEELAKIKGTVLVVFDDNISGGATLSDVCYQFKQQGIQYIIPITFGKMSEKWTNGRVALTMPTNNQGEKGKWNY